MLQAPGPNLNTAVQGVQKTTKYSAKIDAGDFFIFIIIFGLFVVGIIIYRNYKHVGNKTSGKLN